MIFQNENNSGQSLVEVLVAVAIGAVLIIAAAGVIALALRSNAQATKLQTGAALAKELLENVRVWAEGDWHNILNVATTSANHYYLNSSSSPFTSLSGDQSVSISSTTYTRYFYVSDVYREVNSDIIIDGVESESPSLKYDPSTKKVTIAYSWPRGATNTISQYVTRSRNNVFIQTDWSGGPGQNGPATTTNTLFSTSTNIAYDLTAGSISLDLSFTGALTFWNNTTPLPIPMVVAADIYNGYIYAISAGATDECGLGTSTVIYGQADSNGAVSSWSATTPLPNALAGEAFVVYNGYAYVIAGAATTSTVRYASINGNGTLGSWTNTTPLPNTLYDHSSVAYNGYMYVLGGRGWGSPSTEDTSTVLFAQINGNGTLGSWTPVTALPGRDSWLAAVAYNGYLYQVGGYYNSNPSGIVQYAPINGDGTIGSWSRTTDVPAAVEKHALAINNGYLYIVGGTDNAHTFPSTSTVRYAKINSNGTLGSWTEATALPSNVQTTGAVFYNNYLFSVGGNVGDVITQCVGTSTVVSARAQ
ncbi:MAG: prepilin-type N-terminal cleavage/methylation domain-containing protein [Patescibacteria group bacterium]